MATVSNVLNGRQERVGLATRDRVLAAVRELGYQPTVARQSRSQLKTVGLFVGNLGPSPVVENTYFGMILEGVLESLSPLGYATSVYVERLWLKSGEKFRQRYDGRCDAAIFVAPELQSELLRQLHERGMPIVVVGTTVSELSLPTVDIDNEAVGRKKAEHLYGLGHRWVAYLAPDEDQASIQERFGGFRMEFLERGAPPPRLYQPKGVEFEALAGKYVQEWLRHEPTSRPTALAAWNDDLARRLLDQFKEAGVQVPGHVSVIGCDDSAQAAEAHPPLTTVRQPLSQIGKRAASLVLRNLESSEASLETVRYIPELILRESSREPAVPPKV